MAMGVGGLLKEIPERGRPPGTATHAARGMIPGRALRDPDRSETRSRPN